MLAAFAHAKSNYAPQWHVVAQLMHCPSLRGAYAEVCRWCKIFHAAHTTEESRCTEEGVAMATTTLPTRGLQPTTRLDVHKLEMQHTNWHDLVANINGDIPSASRQLRSALQLTK